MDSMTGLMVGANCLIYSGASFLDHRLVGRVAWMEAAGGLELELEGLRKVFGMGDRIRRWHATGSSFSLKRRARKCIFCFGSVTGMLCYSTPFILGQNIFFPSERAIRLTRRDCAFRFNTVIESRSNYMSMRNACLISLIFPDLSPLRGCSMCADS